MVSSRPAERTTRVLTAVVVAGALLTGLPAPAAHSDPALDFTGPACQNGTVALLAQWDGANLPTGQATPTAGTQVDLDTSPSGYPAGSVQLTYAAVAGQPYYDQFTVVDAADEYNVPSFEMGARVQGPPNAEHTVDLTFPHPVSVYFPVLDVDTLESGTIEGFNGAVGVAGTVAPRDPTGGLTVSTTGSLTTYAQPALIQYSDEDAEALLDVTFSSPVTRIRISASVFAGSLEVGNIWGCQSQDVVKATTAPPTVVGATSSTVTYHGEITLHVGNAQPSGQLRVYRPQVTDDLGSVLSGSPAHTALSVTGITATGAASACAANPAFDGDTDTGLLATAATSYLAPGQSCTVTVGIDVTYPWTRSGFTKDNTAAASAAGSNPTVRDASTDGGTLPTSPRSDVPGPTPLVFPAWSPALDLVKTADRTSLAVGQAVTYALTATNTGTTALTGVAIDEAAFTGAGPLSALTCTPTQPRTLATGDALRCVATYVVTQEDVDAGAVRNTATVSGRPPIGPSVTAAAQVAVRGFQVSGLSLVKSASISADANHDGLAAVGDELTFRFAVQNTGGVTLTALGIADQLVAPAGPALSVSCSDTTLSPGESVTCLSSVYVVTQADVDAGAVRNTATASGTTPAGPAVVTSPSSTVTPTPGPGISVVKSADLGDHDGDREADVGETVDYGFVVTNTGATTLREVVVDDGRLTALGLAVTCPATTLAPGGTVACTSPTYVVTRGDVEAGAVVNVATSTGTTPRGVEVTSPPSRTRIPVDLGGWRPVLPTTGSSVVDTVALALALVGLGGLVQLLRRRYRGRVRQAG